MATPSCCDGAPEGQLLQPSCSNSSTMRIQTKPARLTYRELEEITDYFSEERLIGKGSYGKVYKGILKNGEEIAVKLLYNNMAEIIDEKQFQHEFDNLIKLNQENIVRLVFYCYETQHHPIVVEGKSVFAEKICKALCFEYMPNGSLQTHLYDETEGPDWQTRYKIIKGICQGIKYLHEELEDPIYHLDLKPDNILLDENMVPKLADFGVSKLCGEKQTMVTQSPVGTIGYMPKEYLYGNVISKTLDIFSLGVIITQIIAGPQGHNRSADMACQEFLDQVKNAMSLLHNQDKTVVF